MNKKLIVMAMVSLLAACQTPPDIQQLQNEKTRLQNRLDEANAYISTLKKDESNLQSELAERSRVMGVLSEEKSSRVVSSTQLRGQVRQFVQQQLDLLKGFLLEGNLLDYIGGELVARTAVDKEPLLVVDLANAVPKDGSLTSVGGYFSRAGSLRVKVMRKVADNLVVVWESQSLVVNDSGIQKVNFSVSVGVQKGDVIAYYLGDPGMAGFDDGTGDTRYLKEDMSFGTSIRQSSLLGEKYKRSYSLGVYGLLDTE